MARLVRVPIMADESACSRATSCACMSSQPPTSSRCTTRNRAGCIGRKEVVAVAKACDFTCDIGGSIEMGIGVAANLHLGCPQRSWLGQRCPVPNPDGGSPVTIAGTYYLDDIITEPLRYEAGQLYVPSGPGLGIEVDEAKLAKYAA